MRRVFRNKLHVRVGLSIDLTLALTCITLATALAMASIQVAGANIWYRITVDPESPKAHQAVTVQVQTFAQVGTACLNEITFAPDPVEITMFPPKRLRISLCAGRSLAPRQDGSAPRSDGAGSKRLLRAPQHRPRNGDRRAVITDVVHHQHQVIIRPRLRNLVEQCGKGIASLPRVHLPGHRAGTIVHGAEDCAALILARRRDDHGLATPLPDLCQVGMGMEVTFIQVDKPESSPGRSPLFWSSASTCLAEATASASWRWVRSWRGRR